MLFQNVIQNTFGLIGALGILTYILPIIYVFFSKVPNLKQRYNAEWGLVTGGSSGIGLAIVKKLAEQKINVVVVALDDKLLNDSVENLKSEFPNIEFRKVGVNFQHNGEYLNTITQATRDITVQLVFNNAGYIETGFFEKVSLQRQLNNLECNVSAAVQITHHYLQEMIQNGKKGCIVYTSSASAYLPGPFASMYAGTKAFLSQFAAALAIEGKSRGIQVLAVHPSPVSSRFYDKTIQLDALDLAKKFAVGPDELPNEIFKSIGKVCWRDIGGFAVCSRMFVNLASYNFWCMLFAKFAYTLPDFKRQVKVE